MKKLISLALAIVLILSLSTVAFAAGEGTIMIDKASTANTYRVYQLLDLVSHSGTNYSYKVRTEWVEFFTTGAGASYVSTTVDGGVYYIDQWKKGEDLDESFRKAFAQAALTYATSKSIAPVRNSENPSDYVTYTDGEGGIKFLDLDLGYYLVDSTMGALCALTTTDTVGRFTAKNGAPKLDKEVYDGVDWEEENVASIGDTVQFRCIIEVHKGAQNYVLHDKMDEGLTFTGITSITHYVYATGTTTEVPSGFYTIKTGSDTTHPNCTFEIVFNNAFADHLSTNDKVYVNYSAILNENAEVVNKQVAGEEVNENEARLDYGSEDKHWVEDVPTKTYSFAVDLVKTKDDKTLLSGAKFKIYDAITGGNEVPVVKDGDVYRRAVGGETGEEISVDGGKVRLEGFGKGTYYLEETAAPSGYNMLTTRKAFTIMDDSLEATITGNLYESGGVQVVNSSGSKLPETGAMGTAMFVSFGVIVMLGTGVLLVTKKRMSMIED